MRTDVKIGIAGGLLLVVGFVIYMVVNSGPADTPEDPADGGTVSGLHDPTDDPGTGGGTTGTGTGDGSLDPILIDPGPTDVWGGTDSSGGGPDTGAVAGGTDPADTSGGGIGIPDPAPVDTTGGGLAVGVDDGTTDPDPGGTSITMIPSGPIDAATGGGDTTFSPAVDTSSVGPIDPGAPAVVPYPTTGGGVVTGGATDPIGVATGVAGERSHVIKSGDQLWKVAEMYYGSGKHWQLIVSANPGLNPTSMRIGKTIKIPPLPASTGIIAAGGSTTPDPVTGIGEKIYVVRDGDNGMWGVSENAYGHGKYYTAIANRNPTVDSAKLKIGQKLIVPSLEQAKTFLSGGSSTAGTGISGIGAVTGGGTPDPVTGIGEKVYTVRDGDSGMWGVSKSQYGDGKYFSAIANRNPGVNPSRLKIGQKLIIPSLAQAKAFLGGSSIGAPSIRPTTGGGIAPRPRPTVAPRPRPRPAPVAGDDEPDFS